MLAFSVVRGVARMARLEVNAEVDATRLRATMVDNMMYCSCCSASDQFYDDDEVFEKIQNHHV